ncbi:T9SS type A sorting domain-containing protein [Fulvivirga sediminis]|uniref:T9SS type A sorting domain-containing protein n=1 Tax=Fulvivirga sediminis TaxID=2803949 RepID=A0A937F5I5_9BACT|nr:T9SS type A sorting domain-containing protein [Fulvivirga sediminis]MBL3655034.1 T9SS type A sorting domain-containing protein [Fulvivirga sediminis]
MKAILGFVLLITAFNYAKAQEVSRDNYTGSWSSNGSWVDGSAPETANLPVTARNFQINGYISVGTAPAPTPGSVTALSFQSNRDAYDFRVSDTLVVYGDVVFTNKSMNLVIDPGAVMIVLGNLTMANKIELASSGSLVVSGDFYKSGSASQGDYTGTGNVYAGSYSGVAGDFVPDSSEKDVANDLRNDFPDIYDFVQNNGSAPLPISLLSFNYELVDQNVSLEWKTASEENNDYFTLQRSSDGKVFENIAKIAGNGTTNEEQSYSYLDANPIYGTSYYRLLQTDYDGTEHNVAIQAVFNSSVKSFAIFPSPAAEGQDIKIYTGADHSEALNVAVYSGAGQLLYAQESHAEAGYTVLNSGLRSGLYVIKLTSGSLTKTGRLIVE